MRYFFIAPISPSYLREDSQLAADKLIAAGIDFESTLSVEDNLSTDTKEHMKALIDKMLSCDEVIMLENFDHSLLSNTLLLVSNCAGMVATSFNQFMYAHGKDTKQS